jgi:3',5'-cyclic AMP phosphodiesterase CpdA
MRRILHISDVHFGPPHLPAVAEGVLRLVAQRQPDLVVISGDLTQRAKPHQFRAARSWVDRIEAPTVTVPGNHDVPLYRFWERFLAPYGAYSKNFAADLEPVFRDDELLVIGVNTAHGWTFTGGRIRPSRLLELRDLLTAAPEHLFKVVIAHHHLIPPPNFGTQRVLRNSREAIDLFSELGVDLILSGHHHLTYIGNSEEFYPKGRAPVVIVHSGTTTSNRGRGAERDKNSCNWIEAEDQSMVVSHLRWHPELERFAEHSRHWYPLHRRSPYTLEGIAPGALGSATSRLPAAAAETGD